MLVTHTPGTAGLAGGVAFVLVFVLEVASSQRRVTRFFGSLDARFPRDAAARR
jgi:hypothetical protein